MLLAGTTLIWMFSDRLVGGMKNTMVESFMAIGNFEDIPGMLQDMGRQGLIGILMLLLPVVVGITVVSVTISIVPGGFLWTWKPLGPNFGKVFGLSGFKKLLLARLLRGDLQERGQDDHRGHRRRTWWSPTITRNTWPWPTCPWGNSAPCCSP